MQREFEINIDISYKNKFTDEWGAANLYDDESGYGVDYNYCVEDVDVNSCAMYLMKKDNDGVYDTYYDCFRHYEIEWDKADWQDRLEKQMNEFLDDMLSDIKVSEVKKYVKR